MFEPPQPRPAPAELIRGLAVLAEPPTHEHPRIVEALGLGPPPSAVEYSDLFLFQLYPYASVHLGAEGMMGGEAQARVAGFWQALGYEPPAEPDHLSALLGLYASLSEAARPHAKQAAGPTAKEGAGPQDTTTAHRRLVEQSARALLEEHLAPWVFAFLTRVSELSAGVYRRWAELLEVTLREELRRGAAATDDTAATDDAAATDVLPLHLRLAPTLPDPRESGATAFVSGLLAPVRAGFVLTRADVATMAARCDLGLRAGERRYALEHLLAQDGRAVLDALASEARRQGDLHEARAPWLGSTATFLAGRAHDSASLLRSLAAEEPAGAEAAS